MIKRTTRKTRKILIDGTWQFSLPDDCAQSIVLAAMIFQSICPAKLIDAHNDGRNWRIHINSRIPANPSPDVALKRYAKTIGAKLQEIFTGVDHDLRIVSIE